VRNWKVFKIEYMILYLVILRI